MTRDESTIPSLSTTVRPFPPDLTASVLLASLSGVAVLAPGIAATHLRVVLGIPLLVFLPGYVLTCALFPAAKDSDARQATGPSSRTGTGIGGFERFALSVGTSVAVNSTIGFLLDFTPWGIRLLPVLVGIYGFTVATAIVAANRRHRTPSSERYSVPFREWGSRIRHELLQPATWTDNALNALLIVSVILAAGSVAYAVGVPQQQDSFTQFYVLSNDGSADAEAEGYPDNLTVGGNESVYVGIENREHRRVDYAVVVLLQRFHDNSTRVTSTDRLDEFRVSLAPNETVVSKRTLSPTTSGDRLRVTYLLYRGEPPERPTTSNAYRTAYFWTNVTRDGRDPSGPEPRQ